MATKTNASGQIVPAKKQDNSLMGLLQKMGPELAKAVPKHVDPDRMARIALTALRGNRNLQECTPGSFLGSVMSAAQLGLEPNTPLGHCYLIPYKRECTLQIGYRGMMDIARRSGQVTAIYAHPVYEGDDFRVELGLSQNVHHIPSGEANREEKPLTHVYAVAKLKGGEPVFVVLTKAQVDKYRKRSRASGSGPWVTDYEAMALKTAIRRLFTWLPQSAEMARAVAVDESPEIGRQSDGWDPQVQEALEAHGIELDHDPETGEVGERMSEMGEEG
jgi:recombination protein RecT